LRLVFVSFRLAFVWICVQIYEEYLNKQNIPHIIIKKQAASPSRPDDDAVVLLTFMIIG
jgi:hypothetical protein